MIPPLGLWNHWYPAVLQRDVLRGRPLRVRMLGQNLCLFRTRRGDVAALSDVCPHRGGSLSDGDCHYPGTVACPYHGWVFEVGAVLASDQAVLADAAGFHSLVHTYDLPFSVADLIVEKSRMDELAPRLKTLLVGLQKGIEIYNTQEAVAEKALQSLMKIDDAALVKRMYDFYFYRDARFFQPARLPTATTSRGRG
jgi:nitrite reductase/ring-hydroxylating ferredoxin subunit